MMNKSYKIFCINITFGLFPVFDYYKVTMSMHVRFLCKQRFLFILDQRLRV